VGIRWGGQTLGADFRFKSQQQNFGEIRRFLVKSEGNELQFRQEKNKKMERSDFSEEDKNTDSRRKAFGK
jgi:hypothetical protein